MAHHFLLSARQKILKKAETLSTKPAQARFTKVKPF